MSTIYNLTSSSSVADPSNASAYIRIEGGLVLGNDSYCTLAAWVGGTHYYVGDIVSHSGTAYYCTTANTDASFTVGNWASLGSTGSYAYWYSYDSFGGSRRYWPGCGLTFLATTGVIQLCAYYRSDFQPAYRLAIDGVDQNPVLPLVSGNWLWVTLWANPAGTTPFVDSAATWNGTNTITSSSTTTPVVNQYLAFDETGAIGQITGVSGSSGAWTITLSGTPYSGSYPAAGTYVVSSGGLLDSANQHCYTTTNGAGATWIYQVRTIGGTGINPAAWGVRPSVLYYGDSITQGQNSSVTSEGIPDEGTNWTHLTASRLFGSGPTVAKGLYGYQTINRGITSTTVYDSENYDTGFNGDATARLQNLAKISTAVGSGGLGLPAPSVVCVLYGTNDVQEEPAYPSDYTSANCYPAYSDMLLNATNGLSVLWPLALIVCQRLLYRSARGTDQWGDQSTGTLAEGTYTFSRAQFSTEIQAIATGIGSKHVVVAEGMFNAYESADVYYSGTSYRGNDGLHPSPNDYGNYAMLALAGSPPAWVSGANYTAGFGSGLSAVFGEFVSYQGATYQCISSVSGTTPPPADSVHWKAAPVGLGWDILAYLNWSTGTPSGSPTGMTTITVASTGAVGGIGLITYQYYRSTTSGITGSSLSGATNLVLADSGLSAGTTYYYTLAATDANGNTVYSAQSAGITTLSQSIPNLVPNKTWINLAMVDYNSSSWMLAPTAVIYGATGNGAGYANNDVVTLVGGYFTTAARFKLTVVGGNVTAATLIDSGEYAWGQYATPNYPSNPASVTGGTGAGLKLTLSWGGGTSLNDAGAWVAENIDLIDDPGNAIIPYLAAQTNAQLLGYEEYFSQYIDDGSGSLDPANANLQAWCAANFALYGFTSAAAYYETMFLHYATPTAVDMNDGNGPITLPGYGGAYSDSTPAPLGSRVPAGYTQGGWLGNVGLPCKVGSRVVMNVGNPNYQAWRTAWSTSFLSSNGYTGLFIDDSQEGCSATPFIPYLGYTVVPSGTPVFYEYSSSTSLAVGESSYAADYVACVAATASRFAGNYAICANVGNYPTNWTALFPYVTSLFREFLINPVSPAFLTCLNTIAPAQVAGLANIVIGVNLSDKNGCNGVLNYPGYFYDDWAISVLAQYYLMAMPADYFCNQVVNQGDPTLFFDFGALHYNVGSPISSGNTPVVSSQGTTGCYVFATGLDPSSPYQDSGSGAWAPYGSQYKLTDNTKNWANNWAGAWLQDSAGRLYNVVSSTTTTITVSNTPGHAPSSDGVYGVATYYYTVYARQYSNSLMLFKSSSSSSAGLTVAAATVAIPGSGYTNGDIVTVANNSGAGVNAYGAAPAFKLSVSGGLVVTGATLYNGRAGNYSTAPSGPVSVIGGTGLGLTLNLTMTGTSSLTTHAGLPASPTGNWYFLNADFSGTVAPTTPITTISLSTGKAAILVSSPTSPSSGGSAPVISSGGNPSNDTVNAGGTATFTAAATGSPTPTVQWQVSTDGGISFANTSDGALYSGSTTGTLTITGATVGMNGYEYQAVFTNTSGTATTTAATLTVNANVTATLSLSCKKAKCSMLLGLPVTCSLTSKLAKPRCALGIGRFASLAGSGLGLGLGYD